MNLQTRIDALNKVGKTIAKRLERMNIFNVENLLNYFPFRYEDFSRIVKIDELREGETVTVKGIIEIINNRRTKNRRSLTEALLSDASGSVRLVWFNQPFLIKNLEPGTEVFISGTVKRDMLGLQFVGPSYELLSNRNIHTARLVPMYPLTEGITQKQIRFLIEQSLLAVAELKDWLPEKIKIKNNFVNLEEAVRQIHFPESSEKLAAATERLKFDELFLVQIQTELARLEQAMLKAPSLAFHEENIKKFVAGLPFILTKDQKIAAWEILQNIASEVPMNRLLSGDVGSGKTVVAAVALYNTVLSGYQAIMMAPTEILAEQHFKSLIKLLPNQRIVLFTRSHNLSFRPERSVVEKSLTPTISERDSSTSLGMTIEVTKKQLKNIISDGEVDIILGTHALLSEGVEFKKLGLVVVDEQHRFGVLQRKIIKEKGQGVHFLSMTATPIPRSLALMLYGDLDVSVIREMPPGRKQIFTRIVEPHNRDKAYDFIKNNIMKGGQAFVVCPLIEDNPDALVEKKSVLTEYKKLSEEIFPELRIRYLNGRMKSDEKEKIMVAFKNKEFDILVSTSVIEVGVDVPNATVMMIEGADRFGLAQLHQFRGRVGRSDKQSYCFIFFDNISSRTLGRLRFFEKHQNGFELAEKDLELRGPGEVYGTTQSGMMQLRLAKPTDVAIIKKAREEARQIVGDLSKYPELREKLKNWEESVHLE